MVVHGYVKNGSIVLDDEIELPEGMPVQVTFQTAPSKSSAATDYESWLDGLAGRWQGDLVGGNEGDFETRESLP
jgi:hypothetical protein